VKLIAAFLAGGIFMAVAAFAGFHLIEWKAGQR
jgi:hypothetical protein